MPGRVNSESGKAPVVLLATAERWTSTARMALTLRALGCDLVLLAPTDHPASVTGAMSRQLRYDPLRPLHSLRRALTEVEPTTVLPADETVACQLGELWGSLKTRGRKQREAGMPGEREVLGDLLTRSLGDPERLCEAGLRMALQRAAEMEGIPTPATMEITAAGDLAAAFEQLGSPLVLKADGSSGGRGVRAVTSLQAAERVYRGFASAPHIPRALLRGVLHRDWTHVRSSMRRERRGVTAQRMIPGGMERTAMAVAHRGNLLAVESFEVMHTWKLRGPSSVLRRVHDPRMDASIRALVRRLGVTGFCGFDFIVDPASGVPLLLERNARPTQTAHLSFGYGHDLAAAYVRSVVGFKARDRQAATGLDLIALFPHELQRDAESPALRTAYHDVPWESPALTQRALRGDIRLQAALAGQRKRAPRRSASGSFQVANHASA